MNNNLKIYTAFYLGLLLKRKKIDPIEIFEYFLLKFKRANNINKLSFTKVLIKEAFDEAELSWKRQKRNERLSFFDGIPIVWKDLIDIKGYPAYAGSKFLKKHRENKVVRNAKIVDLAKKSGLISFAKTSTVEFAFGGLGVNNSWKMPTNLMLKDKDYAPGGSSTGSATAVYSGLAPIAVATDTAGSVRIPAAWHSLVGFKPSSNKISKNGVLPLSSSYDTVGTICKSVKDTKILFDILSEKKNNYQPHEIKNIKLGFVTDFNFALLDNLSKNKIEQLRLIISKLGFIIKNIQIPELQELNDLVADYGSVVNYEAWENWKDIIDKNLDFIDLNVVDRFMIGKRISNKKATFLKRKKLKLKMRFLQRLGDTDFILLPTVSIKPPKLNLLKNKKKYHFYNNLVLDNTRAANIFDLCSISIPLNFNKRKWLSISIISKKNNDEKLLAVAEKIESILI